MLESYIRHDVFSNILEASKEKCSFSFSLMPVRIDESTEKERLTAYEKLISPLFKSAEKVLVKRGLGNIEDIIQYSPASFTRKRNNYEVNNLSVVEQLMVDLKFSESGCVILFEINLENFVSNILDTGVYDPIHLSSTGVMYGNSIVKSARKLVVEDASKVCVVLRIGIIDAATVFLSPSHVENALVHAYKSAKYTEWFSLNYGPNSIT